MYLRYHSLPAFAKAFFIFALVFSFVSFKKVTMNWSKTTIFLCKGAKGNFRSSSDMERMEDYSKKELALIVLYYKKSLNIKYPKYFGFALVSLP